MATKKTNKLKADETVKTSDVNPDERFADADNVTTIEREDGTVRTDMLVEGKEASEAWKQENDNA